MRAACGQSNRRTRSTARVEYIPCMYRSGFVSIARQDRRQSSDHPGQYEMAINYKYSDLRTATASRTSRTRLPKQVSFGALLLPRPKTLEILAL